MKRLQIMIEEDLDLAVQRKADEEGISKAAVIRRRIEATVSGRAPQVMVKVTGGGRGMGAIAAHLRYISKSGRVPFEDDRGVVRDGPEAWRDLVDQWRCGGGRIPERSERREAFNIIKAAEAGKAGNPNDYRDYLLPRPRASRRVAASRAPSSEVVAEAA